jgi:hypothetical protein
VKACAILASLLLARFMEAAIPVAPAGSGLQTFNMRPNVPEWATWFVPGGSSDISTPGQLDSLVQTQSVARFTAPLWVDFSSTPSFHVPSGWSGSRQAAYTGPGGTAANVLLATLSNAHPADMTRLRVGYRQDVLLPSGPLIETVPGQRVFYSFTGEPNSWVFIPELSDDPTPGYRQAWLDFPSWPSGALLYLLWADDNSQFEDGIYTIDDFAADNLICDSFPWLQPFQDLNVVEGQSASFSINLCPHERYNFQWYRHDVLLPGATNATLTFSPVRLGDGGSYFATLSGASGNLQSRRATLTVSPDITPPAALVAYRVIGTNGAGDRIGVYFSERVNTNTAGRIENYTLRNYDGTEAQAAILEISIVNESNVVLSTDPLLAGVYNLVVSNVLDRAVTANSLSPNPTTLPVQEDARHTVVPVVHPWKYFEATNLTVPPGWQLSTFNDAEWPTGAGALGFPFNESLPPPFEINTSLGPPSGNGAITTCFRTRFLLGPDQTNRVLQLAGVFDDGAAVYLNGQQVWRERLPPGPLSATAYATNAPENFGPLASGPVDIFVPGLLQRTNVLAVEVHQVTITSGDVVMGLTARLSELPCVPELAMARLAEAVAISWTCSGMLQVRTNLSSGAWQDIQTVTNRLTTNVTADAMFFRVRR